jgi:hypothetical protein
MNVKEKAAVLKENNFQYRKDNVRWPEHIWFYKGEIVAQQETYGKATIQAYQYFLNIQPKPYHPDDQRYHMFKKDGVNQWAIWDRDTLQNVTAYSSDMAEMINKEREFNNQAQPPQSEVKRDVWQENMKRIIDIGKDIESKDARIAELEAGLYEIAADAMQAAYNESLSSTALCAKLEKLAKKALALKNSVKPITEDEGEQS